MGIGQIGTTGFLLIIIVALLLFGPSKLPELGRAFGRTLREFKNGARDLIGNDDDAATERKEVNAVSVENRKADEKPNEIKRLPD
jgi:sec-independent protein translocase protein TatA